MKLNYLRELVSRAEGLTNQIKVWADDADPESKDTAINTAIKAFEKASSDLAKAVTKHE